MMNITIYAGIIVTTLFVGNSLINKATSIVSVNNANLEQLDQVLKARKEQSQLRLIPHRMTDNRSAQDLEIGK